MNFTFSILTSKKKLNFVLKIFAKIFCFSGLSVFKPVTKTRKIQGQTKKSLDDSAGRCYVTNKDSPRPSLRNRDRSHRPVFCKPLCPTGRGGEAHQLRTIGLPRVSSHAGCVSSQNFIAHRLKLRGRKRDCHCRISSLLPTNRVSSHY